MIWLTLAEVPTPDLSTSFLFGSHREFHGNERKNVIEQPTYIMNQEARERDKFDGLASKNSLAGTLLSDLAVSMKPCLPWILPFTPVPTLGTKSLNHRPLGTFISKLLYLFLHASINRYFLLSDSYL